MIDLARIAALVAVLGTAVVYGTDVFCAMVQRPALAAVDDRALVAVMGNVHRYGDRRMPLPGVVGLVAAAASAGNNNCVDNPTESPVIGTNMIAAKAESAPPAPAPAPTDKPAS